ncbi:hypothetical protein GCM10028809_67580 [Spirosoma gilvum]
MKMEKESEVRLQLDKLVKRQYHKPDLIKFGNVKQLTLGAGSAEFDESSGIEDLF